MVVFVQEIYFSALNYFPDRIIAYRDFSEPDEVLA